MADQYPGQSGQSPQPPQQWQPQQGQPGQAPQQGYPVQPVQPQQGYAAQPVQPQQGQPGQVPQQWQQPVQQVPHQPQQQFSQQAVPPQGYQPPVQQPMPQGYQQQPVQQPAPQGYQQPPVQQPDPNQPVRYHVHHSYIWLGTLRVAFSIAIALFFAVFAIMLEDAPIVINGTKYGSTLLAGLGILALFVILLALVVVLQVFSYKHLYYELGPEEFNLYSGIFNKKRVHIPYQRVQSVNQKATLIQRIVGVCVVNIDTAGGSANKAVVIPYIQNTAAEHLRAELFARKQMILAGQAAQAQPGTAAAQAYAAGTAASATQGMPGAPMPQGYQAAPGYAAVSAQGNVLDAPAEILTDVRGVFGGMAYDTGAVSYEYGMTNKELIFTGLSNNTGFVIMVLAILGTVMGLVDTAMSTAIGQWAVDEGASAIMRFISENAIPFVIGFVILILIVIWFFSIVGTCISYGGFHARRRHNRIEVEHGLLQHQFHGVDIDRVQSVIIKQSFIRRLIGYCELSLGKIDAAAENSGEQQQALAAQGVIVHPFVKMSKVPEILAGLVPEFADVPTETQTLPKVALRRAIIRRSILKGNGFWLAVLVTIWQIGFPLLIAADPVELGFVEQYATMISVVLYALAVILFVLDIVGAVLWYRGSSFAFNRNFMQISNGGFSRESVCFPRKKIQFGYTKTNPFQRNARVATINARTAAGVGGTTFRLVDAYVDDAEAWLEWLKPRKNMVQ